MVEVLTFSKAYTSQNFFVELIFLLRANIMRNNLIYERKIFISIGYNSSTIVVQNNALKSVAHFE